MATRTGWTAIGLLLVLVLGGLGLAGQGNGVRPARAQAGPTPVDLLAGNLLVNPGFEGGFTAHGADELVVGDGWQPWWDRDVTRPEFKDEPHVRYRPDGGVEAFSLRVFHGANVQKFFSSSSVHDAGLYQQARVPAGERLRFRSWVQVWSSDCDDPCVSPREPCRIGSTNSHGTYRVQVGIDPSGAPPPAPGIAPPASVVWSDPIVFEAYDRWHELTVETTAMTETVTVYTRGHPTWPVKHNDSYWDDARLEVVSDVPTATATGPTATPSPSATPTGRTVTPDPSATSIPSVTAGPSPTRPPIVAAVALPLVLRRDVRPVPPTPSAPAPTAASTATPTGATSTATATAAGPTATAAGPTPTSGGPTATGTGVATATGSATPTPAAGASATRTPGPSPTAAGPCVDLVTGGGFEDGTISGWQLGPADGPARPELTAVTGPDGGDWSLRVGLTSPLDDQGPSWAWASRPLAVPVEALSLTVGADVRPRSLSAGAGSDWTLMALRDAAGHPLRLVDWTSGADAPDWRRVEVSLEAAALAGRTVQLAVEAYNDGDGAPSALLVDNVRVEACSLVTTATGPTSGHRRPADDPVPPGADVRIEFPIRAFPGQENFEQPTCDELSFESVLIRNHGVVPVEMGGWTLEDRDGNAYTFPPLALGPDDQVRVWTGAGRDTTDGTFTDLYWGRAAPVWDNAVDRYPWDEAVLRDDEGTEVARRGYP